MPGLTSLLWCSLILATTILSPFSSSAQGQLPDAKPKATGSISGHVTIGDKPAPGVLIAAFAESPNRRPAASRWQTTQTKFSNRRSMAPRLLPSPALTRE